MTRIARATMRSSRSALIAGALLIASLVGIVLVAGGRLRGGERGQKASVAVTPAVPRLSSEPRLPLPTFEAEATVDAKLIPTLRMPFPAGVVVLCSQGNASEPEQTHA